MTGRLDLKSLETADRKIVIKPFNRLSSKLIVTDCIKWGKLTIETKTMFLFQVRHAGFCYKVGILTLKFKRIDFRRLASD